MWALELMSDKPHLVLLSGFKGISPESQEALGCQKCVKVKNVHSFGERKHNLPLFEAACQCTAAECVLWCRFPQFPSLTVVCTIFVFVNFPGALSSDGP